MKYVLALLSGAAFVAAQSASGLAAIPSCGQMCINNMVQIANTQFGCSNGNVTCYCSDPRFGYGLNDCSLQACGAAVQSQVLSFGLAYCSSAGVAPNTGAPSVASSASASLASSASGGGAVPITTSPVLTTVSASNTLYTSTVGSTTIYSTSASGATGAAGNATSAAGGAISSAISGASSAGSAGASKASSAGSAGASGASSAAGGGSSSSSSGMGAIATVAPMVGACAIAALLL